MSDPQQPQVPPYASNAGQPPTPPPGYPAQPTQPAQPTYPAQQAYPAQPTYPAQQTYPGQQQYGAQPTYSGQPSAGQPSAGQPVQPTTGYTLNGHSPQPGYPSGGASTNANPPGRLGFIIGLVGLGVGLLFTVIFQVIVRSGGWEVASVVSGLGSVLAIVAAILALIFGINGLRREGAPHGQAGIAVGLGIAGITSGVFAFLINAVSSLFYY